MKKFYYSDIFQCQESYDILKDELKKTKSIIFIPGSNDFINNENEKNKILELLQYLGIYIKYSRVLSPYENKNNTIKDIINTDIIFFLDGNPEKQLEIIELLGIKETLLNSDSIIIGTKNGTKTMSKDIWYPNRRYKHFPLYIINGLEFSNISVIPNYNTEGIILDTYENEDSLILRDDILKGTSKSKEIYLLNDANCIIEENKEITYIGNDIIKVMPEGIIRFKITEKQFK